MSNDVDTGSIQDKTEPTENTQNSAENTNTEVTDTLNQESKTFTQAELNSIIAKRLDKYKDYEDLAKYRNESEEAKLTEVEKLQSRISELEGYETSSKAATKQLEKVLENTLENIDEDKKNLIPKSFSLTEKLDYINKNKGFLMSNNTNIVTPSDGKTATFEKSSTLLFGKYNSVKEFAELDPKEFRRAYTTKEYRNELIRLG
jgi:CRISPR/Cas system CSM-associated protein Csm2 small subunit